VTRERLIAWLTAVVLACLGGAVVAAVVTLALRRWLDAWDDALLIGVGYVTWVLASAVISAVWLRRTARL
jgi:hypothetical protein